MSLFSHTHPAHQALDGLHSLAAGRLPQLTTLSHPAGQPAQDTTLRAAHQLHATLSQVFGGADQILFDLAVGGPEQIKEQLGNDSQLRVDAASQRQPRPASLKRLIAALGLAKAKETLREDDWVVLVADETTLDLDQAMQLLQQSDGLRRFLLVWCGRQTSPLEPRSATDGAGAAPMDQEGLIAALAQLKAQSTAAIFDLQLQQTFLAPALAGGDVALSPSGSPIVSAQIDSQSSGAVDALWQMAAKDRRIVIVSLDAESSLAPLAVRFADRYFEIPTGDADALAWCAGLAAGGCRPVLCVNDRTLARWWSALADEICRPQHAVKIVVLPAIESDECRPPSSLELLRILPDTPLLVARDSGDLPAMLEFSVAYDGPASIWFSPSLLARTDVRAIAPGEAGSDVPMGTATRPCWQFGRAEVIGSAVEVALIGWGETAAAAERAAQFLSGTKLRTRIVNARFLQPLDGEAIVDAARAAQFCLVLDDARWHAGFAAEVLELLAAASVTTPTSVLRMQDRRRDFDLRDARDDFALQIADRCRWLAEPVRPEFRPSMNSGDMDIPPTAQPGSWLQLFGPPAAGASQPAQAGTSSQSPASALSDWLIEFDPAQEQRQIRAVEFSSPIRAWIRDYEMVGNRNVYLWRWCLYGLRLTTLPCVEPALRQDLCDTKLLAVMLGVMLDDIADLGGNQQLLKALNEVLIENKPVDLSPFDAQEQAYGRFTVRLASETWNRLRGYSRFSQYEEVLIYDHRQIVNAMDYSSLLNRNLALMNLAEHDVYSPHNMQMMSFATMDLMASRDFDRRELGRLRAVIWHAQSMGRIGNLLSTWQREVRVRDFTSGVFARAVQQGDLGLDDLEQAPVDSLQRAIESGGHDAYFAERWCFHQRAIEALVPRIRSVDLRSLLIGLKRLISMELGSRGLK